MSAPELPSALSSDGARHSPVPKVDAEAYLKIAVARLVEQFQPVRIILFGSRARGDARPDSDIDLLVVMRSATGKLALMVAMLDALADRRIPVDIVVTDPEEVARRGDLVGSVLRPALREGTLLYERD